MGSKIEEMSLPKLFKPLLTKGLEERFVEKHNQSRVFSYVQKYEFEGLLFSETEAFDRLYGGNKQYGQRFKDIRSQFHTPEDINDNRETAPSKRLASVIPR